MRKGQILGGHKGGAQKEGLDVSVEFVGEFSPPLPPKGKAEEVGVPAMKSSMPSGFPLKNKLKAKLPPMNE